MLQKGLKICDVTSLAERTGTCIHSLLLADNVKSQMVWCMCISSSSPFFFFFFFFCSLLCKLIRLLLVNDHLVVA